MTYTSKQITDILQKGESQTVEFKLNIRQPSILARIIAAFANSEGGIIIIGIEEPATIVGCDPKQVESVYRAALSRLSPTSKTFLEFVNVVGKQLAVITVEKSKELVLSDEGAFQRVGESIQRMSPANISSSLPQQQLLPIERESIAEGIARLTKMVEDLQQQLEYANSFKGQVGNYLIGGIIGAILGLILTLIFT
jgi:predicted HTH transcriptional regulator